MRYLWLSLAVVSGLTFGYTPAPAKAAYCTTTCQTFGSQTTCTQNCF